MIKVSYCVAYDWQLLADSIPRIYNEADQICVAIDKNRVSWTGKKFSWDEASFRQLLSVIDPLKKIQIFEADFFQLNLSPMENEVRQRNLMAEYIGKDGWHVQLDTDEYFIDFASFARFLRHYKSVRPVNICCPMINLYKQTKGGMLWIKPDKFSEIEFFPIAMQNPEYEYGRRNGRFNILTQFPILHQSWARTSSEVWEKLNNWGHAKDFDVEHYFNLWTNADSTNFGNYKNFHHLHPTTWPQLALNTNIKSLSNLNNVSPNDFDLPIKANNLRYSNSIWLSRMKSVLRKMKSGTK